MATGRIIRPRTQEGWDLLVPRREFDRVQPKDVLKPLDRFQGVPIVFALAGLECTHQLSFSGSGIKFGSKWGRKGILREGTGVHYASPIGFSGTGTNYTVVIQYARNLGADSTVGTWVYNTYPDSTTRVLELTYYKNVRFYTGSSYTTVGGRSFYQPEIIEHRVGLPENIVCVVKGTSVNIWANGAYVGSATQDAVFGVPPAFKISGQITSGAGWGLYSCYAILDGTIDDSAAIDLSRNPYQLFRPANDTSFLYSITGGATVTLSSPTATATGPTTANVGCTVTYT